MRVCGILTQEVWTQDWEEGRKEGRRERNFIAGFRLGLFEGVRDLGRGKGGGEEVLSWEDFLRCQGGFDSKCTCFRCASKWIISKAPTKI